MSDPKPGMFRTADGKSVVVTFVLVSSLFLLWGFCNGMIDVMDKHFQDELHLTLAQSAWVQFAHYLGYFLMALPAGWLATKLGYKGGIIAGLLMVAVGGFWFIPATQIAQFWAFLLGVCFIAAGLTFLETIANPYTTVLGPKQYAATRINLAQSCNGIGWIFGPLAGREFFYSINAAGEKTGAETLWIPYAAVGAVVVVLSVVFYFAPMPDIKTEDEYHLDDATPGTSRSIWTHPHFVMAVVAQFFYVAAQSGIFSFFINYMTSQAPAIPGTWDGWALNQVTTVGADGFRHITDGGAATLASLGFFCFLAGRFSGAAILKKFPAHKVLGLYALLNVIVCGLVFLKLGWISVACVFLSYFFMSIMFPTIFALGIHGLGARAKKASAYIVMAIMGGAIVPKIMGAVGDNYGMSRSFIVPLLCFGVVAYYGYSWTKLSKSEGVVGLNAAKGH
ncbi:MAG: L-fucose:H+ symporter permease [Opitutaceae bacterium]|nr:L-fucose:H+ symporter permease [Opitutaceae bacterium]